jgi:hypothetical protein
MPRISAIACLIAFTWNAALAGMGGLLFCAHETGGMHRVAPAEHTEEEHGRCCHHDGQAQADVAMVPSDCASCEDTLLSGLSLDFTASGFERLSLKTPAVLAPALWNPRFGVLATSLPSGESPIWASPALEDACFEFSDTIRFLC